MTSDDDVRTLQLCYPQIWFACHVAHQTRQRSDLTDRDAGILAHLASLPDVNAAALARHLGIGKSALSAHLARLQRMGLVRVDMVPTDKRARRLSLTAEGTAQLAATSPLDTDRVRALLDVMSADDRAAATRGMQLLAAAARRLREAGATATQPRETGA
jgi:MarR family transcriptional regulator, organic hydroperoxide resistance regulator